MTDDSTKRALWVLAHPDPESLNARLCDVGVAALRADGWDVAVSDLYAMQWNPILVDTGGADVEAEQRKLAAAELVVVQFPLWWYSVPAILKGWIDRVFESGFAFDVPDPVTGKPRKYGDGGLASKRALTIVTAGDRPGSLEPRGISGSIADVLWPLLHGTYWYTGMEALVPHLITDADAVDVARMADLERSLQVRLKQVLDEQPIPYRPMNDEHYDHAIRLHPHLASDDTTFAAHMLGPYPDILRER